MMKYLLMNLILMLSVNSFSQTKVSSNDLKKIIGEWEGTITYLDYQTKKPFTMPAYLSVKQGNNQNSLLLKNIYPNETNANSSERIKISSNGMFLNSKPVTSRNEIESETIYIQTDHKAKDDRKKALIRYTYIISENSFKIRKEVQFEDTDVWIKRSEYAYNKKM